MGTGFRSVVSVTFTVQADNEADLARVASMVRQEVEGVLSDAVREAGVYSPHGVSLMTNVAREGAYERAEREASAQAAAAAWVAGNVQRPDVKQAD